MTTQQAINLSKTLASLDMKANQLLNAKCRENGRSRTFTIMRFGDPRKWDVLPKGKLHPPGARGNRWNEVPDDLRDGRALHDADYHRPCTLERLDTGRRIRAKSIVEFCRKARMKGGNHRFHITPVLNGTRAHHKGWYLPKTLNTVLDIRDVYGNVRSLTVRDWITKHDLSVSAASRLLSGARHSVHGGIMLASSPDKAIIKPRADYTTLVTIQKGAHKVSAPTISQAAAKAGLHPHSLYPVAYGLRPDANGYRITAIKTAKRSILSA